MNLQESGRGVAGKSRARAEVRSLGDAEQQADQQISPKQPGEREVSRAALRKIMAAVQASASRNTAITAGSLTSRTNFAPKEATSLRQGFAIARHGQVSGQLQSLGALPDTGNQHFLFVANQSIKLSLRDARASQSPACWPLRSPLFMKAAKAASRMRSRPAVSAPPFWRFVFDAAVIARSLLILVPHSTPISGVSKSYACGCNLSLAAASKTGGTDRYHRKMIPRGIKGAEQ
jgi:hypothetical protein